MVPNLGQQFYRLLLDRLNKESSTIKTFTLLSEVRETM
jgi:hypothetical protein